MEKKSEELKMGLDAQKSFTQMYEDRNMNKRIWGQVVKLDPIIIQEAREKSQTRDSQSLFKIRGKFYDFARIFLWTIFTQGRTPLDDGFLWQKTIRNKGFQVKVRTLTWHPSFHVGWLRGHSLALARLLGGHPEINGSLHVHTLAKPYADWGARESRKI